MRIGDSWNDTKYTSYAASASEYTKVEDRVDRLYKKRAALKYPDDDLLPGIKHIDKRMTAEEKLKQCNPNFGKGREWKTNCQRTVVAQELIYRGYDVTAMPYADDEIKNSGVKVWEFDNKVWSNDKDVRMAEKRSEFKKLIEDSFGEWGGNSRAVVRVKWTKRNGGHGHFFTARMENGKIIYEDPQSMEIIDINDVLKDCTTVGNQLWAMRIDNRKMNNLVNKAVKGR